MDSHILRHRHVARWSGTALVAAAMLCASSQGAAQQKSSGNDIVARGRYLVGITGCHDCHSPKIKGMTPNLDLAIRDRICGNDQRLDRGVGEPLRGRRGTRPNVEVGRHGEPGDARDQETRHGQKAGRHQEPS